MTLLIRRVPRTNGGTTKRFSGLADRVPTPDRRPLREGGTDTIDRSLVEYNGVMAP
jgi:hypothetical protein